MDFKKSALASTCEVGIILTGDKEIRKLNKKFRGKDKATDVLSFSMIEGEMSLKQSPILGEVVISLDTVIRQAKEYKVNVYQEFLRLLIHGILHLAGYDHEGVSGRKAREMREIEERIYLRFLKAAKEAVP